MSTIVARQSLLAFLLSVSLLLPRLIRAETAAPEKPAVEELPVAELAGELLKQIETRDPESVWDAVNRLVRLGRSSTEVSEKLQHEMLSNDPKVQLACARALCQLNGTDIAAPVLARLIENGGTSDIRRLTANAIGLTTSLYGNEAVSKALAEALKSESDELTRISIARSHWRITKAAEGREMLMKLLLQGSEKKVKDEAALVLAENGLINMQDVHIRLLNLYSEPTVQGERAFNLLRNKEDEDNRSHDPKLAQGEMLMREILRNIQAAYPDHSKYEPDKLFENAAKGMVATLDPFSQYMDREEVKATQELLSQDYGGIGAYVGARNGSFIIISPIYGSPADKAGLRAMDEIREVDGNKANEMMDKGGLNGVITKLKGEPGTPVKLKYYRRGFIKPVEVSITREVIRVESVFSDMLPGDIGYIRLTRFGERSSDEMKTALAALKEKKSRALIFDLRDNPGGLLRSGVDIADRFLEGDKLIVYSEGNKEFAPYKPFRSTGTGDESLPMVVLVGAGSASAAEIVAGCMQDHKRALLIGEKTFGKGSVQQLIPMHATERQTQLRLTIAKYYLPSGRCIHEKGINVDIEVKPPELAGWAIESLIDLRKKNTCDDFIRNTWDANKATYLRLAYNDGKKCENWPGFDDFYKSLNTRLERNDVRNELRIAARRRAQDELKKEMIVDVEEDDVLERGVLELCTKLKLNPLAYSEYKDLPEKFKKKDEQPKEGAMLQNPTNAH